MSHIYTHVSAEIAQALLENGEVVLVSTDPNSEKEQVIPKEGESKYYLIGVTAYATLPVGWFYVVEDEATEMIEISAEVATKLLAQGGRVFKKGTPSYVRVFDLKGKYLIPGWGFMGFLPDAKPYYAPAKALGFSTEEAVSRVLRTGKTLYGVTPDGKSYLLGKVNSGLQCLALTSCDNIPVSIPTHATWSETRSPTPEPITYQETSGPSDECLAPLKLREAIESLKETWEGKVSISWTVRPDA